MSSSSGSGNLVLGAIREWFPSTRYSPPPTLLCFDASRFCFASWNDEEALLPDEDALPADEDVPSASLAAGFAERGGPSSTTSIGTLLLGGLPADW